MRIQNVQNVTADLLYFARTFYCIVIYFKFYCNLINYFLKEANKTNKNLTFQTKP